MRHIRDAFERGIIGYSKVRAMTRVASPDSNHARGLCIDARRADGYIDGGRMRAAGAGEFEY